MMSDASCSEPLAGAFLPQQGAEFERGGKEFCPAVVADLARGRTNRRVGLPPRLQGSVLDQVIRQMPDLREWERD